MGLAFARLLELITTRLKKRTFGSKRVGGMVGEEAERVINESEELV